MKQLSQESVAFIRAIKNKRISHDHSEAWGKHYTRLFCDLYTIIRDINHELNEHALSKWFVTYESTNDQSELSFKFALNLSEKIIVPAIQISIQPFGQSTIEALPADDKKNRDGLDQFYKSAPYKRYFQDYEDETIGLKTVISQKQITSRYFGDYMIHLVNMMKPYLESSCQVELSGLKAA